MAKVQTPEEISASFIEKPMPIIGKPTRAHLIPLRNAVHANACQIQTMLGGGKYGYLGAFLSDDNYAELDDTQPFVEPKHPGNLLVNSLNGTQPVITDALRANKEAIRQFEEYKNVLQALRKQIVDTVEEKYILSLRNKYTRYNNLHPKEILTYLFDTYGKITPEDLVANDKRLIEEWDGVEPFESVIERVNECIEFAQEADREYTENQVLDRVLVVVAKCGLYADDIKDWNKVPDEDKTWPEFQEFMLKAQTEFRRNQQNNKQTGYGMSAEQFEALANLVAAAATNTQTNTNPPAETDVLKEILNRLEKYDQKFEQLAKRKREGKKAEPRVIDNSTYCWTHGYRVSATHNSKTCTKRAHGHNEAATRDNNMGGSQNGKPTSA
jgi:hypothetical protein